MRAAGTRLLALVAVAAVLPMPEPMPRPMRLRARRAPWLSEISFSLMCPFLDAAKPGVSLLSSTRTRCFTLSIMPRTDGVSTSSRVRCILLRPSPISVCALVGRTAGSGCRSGSRAASSCHQPSACSRPFALRAASLCGRPTISPTFLPRRRRDLTGRRAVRERVEGRLDHVVRVGRADRLGDDVLHAQRLEDGAHRAARDDAGARPARRAAPPGRRRSGRSTS